MTDDIVTRLQERIPYAIHPHVLAEAKLLSDAVKEIDRLRKDCNDLWFWVVHLREGDTWCGQREKQCDVCRNYEETLPND